jgi:hypothetical protein
LIISVLIKRKIDTKRKTECIIWVRKRTKIYV